MKDEQTTSEINCRMP